MATNRVGADANLTEHPASRAIYTGTRQSVPPSVVGFGEFHRLGAVGS